MFTGRHLPTFLVVLWRAGIPPLVLLIFLGGGWAGEPPYQNAEDSAWWYPYLDEMLYVPHKEDIGIWGPYDMVGGMKGKHGDVFSQRMVAGKVMWPTPFVLEAGVGLPDVSDCSDWLKIGALARSATAFYGVELVQGVTKWMEIGGYSSVVNYINYYENNVAMEPQPFAFTGRGDFEPIEIRDATGDLVYFDPDSIRVSTEGGTKIRWPYQGVIAEAPFPVMTRFGIGLNSSGYGTVIAPLHRFTFPYGSHCVAWYFPKMTITLPELEVPGVP